MESETRQPSAPRRRRRRRRSRKHSDLPWWFLAAVSVGSVGTIAGVIVGGTEGGLLVGLGGFIGSQAGVALSFVRNGRGGDDE